MGNHVQAPAEVAWGSLLLCCSERYVNVTNDLQISHGDPCNLLKAFKSLWTTCATFF